KSNPPWTRNFPFPQGPCKSLISKASDEASKKGSKPGHRGFLAQTVGVEGPRHWLTQQGAMLDAQTEQLAGAAAAQLHVGQVRALFHGAGDGGRGLLGGFALALHPAAAQP